MKNQKFTTGQTVAWKKEGESIMPVGTVVGFLDNGYGHYWVMIGENELHIPTSELVAVIETQKDINQFLAQNRKPKHRLIKPKSK